MGPGNWVSIRKQKLYIISTLQTNLMKFKIKYTESIRKGTIKYVSNEFSFDTEPMINEIDFDLSFNKIILSVVDTQIAQIWGYAGDVKWANFSLDIPSNQKGILYVVDELECGFSYVINKTPVAVYHNKKSGWVCIGDPNFEGIGVEFIENCVAFINTEGSLISLWIRPTYI